MCSFYSKVSPWLEGSGLPEQEIALPLGTSGDAVTITARSDGTYWIGNSRLGDGTVVTAANGSRYRLRLSTRGLWSAEYVATTARVSLLDETEGVAVVKAEDGSYWLGAMQLQDGTGLTHSLHGTYKLIRNRDERTFRAEPLPAGVPLDVPGLGTATIAGTGLKRFGGDGDNAWQAHLSNPPGVAVDHSGNLLIADTDNHRIRRVSTVGIITTVAGTGVAGFSGDGQEATKARLRNPRGIAVGPEGNVYFADSGNNRIRVIHPNGTINTVVGGDGPKFAGETALADPHAVAVDHEGNLFIVDTGNHRIRKATAGTITTIAGTGHAGFEGAGGPARLAALQYPKGIGVDAVGIVYIADTGNNRIRRIDRDGKISTVMGTARQGLSGDGGKATNAALALPQGLVVAPDRSVYVSDSMNHSIRRIDSDGVVVTVAGTGVAGSGREGNEARRSQLIHPIGLTTDADGRLLVADSGNHRIRRLEPHWNVVSPDSLPTPELVPLGVAGDWARLWRTSNSTYYHDGEPFESGDVVFGWFGQAFRLEHDVRSGWSAEATEIDYSSIFPDMRRAATEGDVSSQVSLGVRYALGLGADENFATALHWFWLAAQQGDSDAESWLGSMHANGNGVPQDLGKAVWWYRRAALKGDTWAQYSLDSGYLYGEGVGQDEEEALKWMVRAAMQDLPSAQDLLGDMYRRGDGVTASPDKALGWYRWAATAGHPWAQISLGRAYRNGDGVVSDGAEAVQWIRFAAERGNPWGQQELGWMYEFGEGIAANSAEAVKWYKLAAVQGWSYSQWRLGVAYMRGWGIAPDDVVALVWLGLAEANGQEEATVDLQMVRARLTQDQVARARSLTTKCRDSEYENCP